MQPDVECAFAQTRMRHAQYVLLLLLLLLAAEVNIGSSCLAMLQSPCSMACYAAAAAAHQHTPLNPVQQQNRNFFPPPIDYEQLLIAFRA
jgi:hypothetical protein